MRILKLPWLGHRNENKPVECYAVTINSSGTKLASGGLDGKVKVWDLASLVHYTEAAGASPEALQRRMAQPVLERPLASMSRHNGVVTSVKFSPDGRFLASGSDDKIVLVWEKDDESGARPRQFGEAEADLEHWTVRKRLVAHDNDVQDICWSPDGSLLITVGLDRSIIIWSGTTFERIKRYDMHQSMVKGIVFDPANKFFATASDDRSVRIFRYYKKPNDLSTNYEFQMEQIVMDPFQKSPLTSYFRRMSWSPDGQHVAVPNATNGPVTSVVIINRGNWATDVSLIGHEAPCEVCSFSPRLFHNPANKDAPAAILASAGQDRTLAVWSTAQTKPLVVAEDIVQKPITDIAWTPDGQALFLSSLDGSIVCVTFAPGELGDVVSEDAVGSQLVKYGGDKDSAIMPETVDQLHLETSAHAFQTSKPAVAKAAPKPPVEQNIPPVRSEPVSKKPQVLAQSVVTKNGKKRVAPTLVSTYSGASTLPVAAANETAKKFDITSKLSQTTYYLPRLGLQSAVHGLRLRSVGAAEQTQANDVDNDNEDMGFDETSGAPQSLSAAGVRQRVKKLRKVLMAKKYPTSFKMVSNLPEALFANQAVASSELAKLVHSKSVETLESDLVNTAALESMDESLYFRVVVNSVNHKHESETVNSIIEVRNGPSWPEDEDSTTSDFTQRVDFQDPTQVSVTNHEFSDRKNYILYFPFKIQQAIPVLFEKELAYYVLVSFDGLVQVIHADTGSYAAPSFELGSNVVASKQRNQYILFLTGEGLVHSWKLPWSKKKEYGIKSIVKGVSVAPVLNAEMTITGKEDGKDKKTPVTTAVADSLSMIDVSSSGLPIVGLANNGGVYMYSVDLMAWTETVDPWYCLAFQEEEIANINVTGLKRRLLDVAYRELRVKRQKGQAGYKFGAGNQLLRETMRTRFGEVLGLDA